MKKNGLSGLRRLGVIVVTAGALSVGVSVPAAIAAPCGTTPTSVYNAPCSSPAPVLRCTSVWKKKHFYSRSKSWVRVCYY